MLSLDSTAETTAPDCRCDVQFVHPPGPTHNGVDLVLESDGCSGDGDLTSEPACRARAVEALVDRDVARVRVRTSGRERLYDDPFLLVAAGRFVEHVRRHDADLAERATRDPLAAAREATGRAGPVARIAAETGLAECSAHTETYSDALDSFVGPTIAHTRRRPRPPESASLVDRRTIDGGSTVRRYRGSDGRQYHLDPPSAALSERAASTLVEAHERLARGDVDGGPRAPARAVRLVAETDDPVEQLASILRKHTRGLGVLEDLFADPHVSDVFATAPVTANPLRVVVDDEMAATNLRLTEAGAGALASRFRRTSARSFSRANPTLDAVVQSDRGGNIRVAGVTDPASDGLGFAFRRHGNDVWTLPALVANGTLTAEAAGLLSLSAERGVAGLVAGPRGAGKTTLLGALLWELPESTRTVIIEDVPELPVAALREHGRDVQALRSEAGDAPSLTPTEALRTALRLGEGALVLGEVRGEEASALYEAMRVGAAASAVLGTIHGDGAEAVRERVVTDLGVPESAFGATDLVVTLETADARRLANLEEVRTGSDGVDFVSLFERTGSGLESTGVLDRGNSRLLDEIARPDESYADLWAQVSDRSDAIGRLATIDRTGPDEVVPAYREQRTQ